MTEQFAYQSGFGNHFSTEALAGALPQQSVLDRQAALPANRDIHRRHAAALTASIARISAAAGIAATTTGIAAASSAARIAEPAAAPLHSRSLGCDRLGLGPGRIAEHFADFLVVPLGVFFGLPRLGRQQHDGACGSGNPNLQKCPIVHLATRRFGKGLRYDRLN